MAARLLLVASALALFAGGCKDRKPTRGAVRVVVDAGAAPVDAGVPDLGFVRGDVVIDQLRDGRHQPARLDPATRSWVLLGDGVGDLYVTGHRLGDGLLAIATVGSHEDDHQEQLAIVIGARVARFGPTAKQVRHPSAAGGAVVFASDLASYSDLYAITPTAPPRRLTDDAAVEDVRDGVEKTPSVLLLLELLEGGLAPLAFDVGYALDVEHVATIEIHDGVVDGHLVEGRPAVEGKGLLLGLARVGQGLDHLHDEPGQLVLGVGGVLTLYHVVGDQGQVVATEHVSTEADPHGEGLVVRVTQGDRVLVATVGGAQHHHPEEAHAVGRDAVLLGHDLVAEVGEGVPHKIHHPMVGDWDVRAGGFRCRDLPQSGEIDGLGALV